MNDKKDNVSIHLCQQLFYSQEEQIKSQRDTAQKMKFSIKDFFSKCEQIRRKLRIWSHLLMKSLMEDFIFCAVRIHLFSSKRTGK